MPVRFPGGNQNHGDHAMHPWTRKTAIEKHVQRAGLFSAASLLCLAMLHSSLQAQTSGFTPNPTTAPPAKPEPANSIKPANVAVPKNAPKWFEKSYRSLLMAPLPSQIYNQGGIPAVIPQTAADPDPLGLMGSFQTGGPTVTKDNAFFQSLGTNGRSCATCHQPPSAMSISLRNIQSRFEKTRGRDPLFAPVDGANCPNAVPPAYTSGALLGGLTGRGKDLRAAHSLLLNKGLIRVALPVPATAEYTVTIVSDAAKCNTDPEFGLAKTGTVSVYRRPLISANLKFKVGTPGSIMWDGREPSLESQAIDATLGHAQAKSAPTPQQVKQIVDFESQFFSAQVFDNKARSLTDAGATGGPENLAAKPFVPLPPFDPNNPAPFPVAFDEYKAWENMSGTLTATQRRSIANGQKIFLERTFSIGNVAGFNDFPGVGNPATATCSACHNEPHSGADFIPFPQRDIGIGGQAISFGGPAPARDLPVFKLTCKAGAQHPFLGSEVTTNDPGMALITGKCADIGKKTVPQLRGLAGHEPYFSDGSARTLLDVVNFYNTRFNIGLTAQEKQDLANFMSAL
jgi:cytochrome c peroxidase